MIRGEDIHEAMVTLRFRWIAEKNPHADGDFTQNPIVEPGLVKIYLNDGGNRRTGFEKDHDARRTNPPPRGSCLGCTRPSSSRSPAANSATAVNTLAFEMPKPLHERDPYVYVYELTVDVAFERRA